MEKLREFCERNKLHIIAGEDNDFSVLAVDQETGCFVVVEDLLANEFRIKTYTIAGGLKVYFAPNGEVRIETLPVKN